MVLLLMGAKWFYLGRKNPTIEVLGRVLYTDYYYLFIVASFIYWLL